MGARIATVPLLALAPLAGWASPAHAATGVDIHQAHDDSPGPDTGSGLDAEYVVLNNDGTTTKTLTGWTLRDVSGHVCTFGTFTLAGGAYVTIHTGSGTGTRSHRYWGSRAHVGNNTGDTAYLRGADGTAEDQCSWGSAGDSTLC